MKNKRRNIHDILKFSIALTSLLSINISSYAQFSPEQINRGLVAVNDGSTGIYVGWRLLDSDQENIAFNLYRITNGASGEKLNTEPITNTTNYFDETAELLADIQYYVKPIINDIEQEPSDTVGVWNQNYLTVELQKPDGGTTPDGVDYTYTPNDASTADLDGDGEYEIIIKWYPTNAKDNSQWGYTGNEMLDAYKMDGTRLWRIDLGINVRSGAHYNPFMVYDLDEDGKAELVCRTAPGTKDGAGAFLSLGPAAGDNDNADYRNEGGYILSGPEYLTVFRGTDGTEMETIDLEPDRGNVSDWGDDYGNRVDRFLAAVLYLDGQHPSIVWCRGIYTKIEIASYSWDGNQLNRGWIFKSQEGYNDWTGMGSHNLSVADVDNDGKDEIVYGHCAIDDNGTGLWTLKNEIGTSTGDAMHLADIIPERPGLERWACGEYSNSGSHLVDAGTGEVIWKTPAGDVGRATAADLTSDFYGMECWGGTDGLSSAYNVKAGTWPSSTNHVVWWDGDLGRELLNDIYIDKYGAGNLLTASGCYSNNGSKANPCLQADLFGDWREEVIWRTSDNNNIRIYTTTNITQHRIKTLMHDQQYRLSVAWQNNSYNQPPHTSFYLGYDMFTPLEEIPPAAPTALELNKDFGYPRLTWTASKEVDLEGYNIYKSSSASGFVKLNNTIIKTTSLNDKNIEFDKVYIYYLTAVDSDGNESEESTRVVALIPGKSVQTPSNVKGSMGFTKAMVYWDSVPAESEIVGFNVYISETSGTNYQKLNVQPVTDSKFISDNLTNYTTYYYVVTSLDNSNNESYYSDETSITPGYTIVQQAEKATFENVTVDSEFTGFNGDGYVEFNTNGYVQFKYVFSKTDGWHNLHPRYALGENSRTGIINANDSLFTYTMEETGDWMTYNYDTIKVYLIAGFKNFIKFEETGQYFGNLDEITIGSTTTAPELSSFSSIRNIDFSTKVYPNPFNETTTITIKSKDAKTAYIKIFNVLGAEIKTARLERSADNRFSFQWNGANYGNKKLKTGLYFVEFFIDGQFVKSEKVVLNN